LHRTLKVVNPSPWVEVVVLCYNMQDCKQEHRQLDNLPHTLVEEAVAVVGYNKLDCKLVRMKEHSSYRTKVQLVLPLAVAVVGYNKLDCKLVRMKEHSSYRTKVQLALPLEVVVVVHNTRGHM